MPSFGEKLKRERTKRAVTLDQISQTTKIGTRMLQALEEEKFNQLPGGIFNKGFVRAYARCIGLDEDQAVADYLEAAGEGAPPKLDLPAHDASVIERQAPPPEPRQEGPARELPWGWFAAFLLLVAVALSFWSYRSREHRAPTAHPVEATSPAVSAPAADGPPAPTNAAQANANSPQPAATAAPPTASPSVRAATPAGQFTVLIQAREDSWISITVDGSPIGSAMLIGGAQRSVHGRKQVVVLAGNAGAVDVFFNGKKVDFQGGYGEVKTLTFVPTGLVPTSPAPAVTP